MSKLTSVLIMAGGTGGHVFPGLAVAKKLIEQNIAVNWLGTKDSFESRVVPEAGIPIHYISISGVRGKGIFTLLFAPFRLLYAVFQAKRIIKKLKPDLVLGMGGFASGPGGIASWMSGVPVVIHEQNAKAGTTNTWLAKIAKRILEGFPNTFLQKNAIPVGNPVRQEIVNIPPPSQRFLGQKNPLRLLVLGGSLGAQALNELVPEALGQLAADMRPHVVHQTGEKHLEKTKAIYDRMLGSLDGCIEVVPFIREMDKAYVAADVVLCRAGALTISELCVAGLGAILVPFPHAVDDHQTANAGFMAKNGAAVLIQQKELTATMLANLLKDFYLNKEKVMAMAQVAYALRKADAAERVVTICKEVCP